VIFAVEDAGPGLPDDLAARIFEPPVLAEGESEGPSEGIAPARSHTSLGLGLVLVGRIARAHGGRAHAETRPGGGARMVVALPIAALS
jgi:two-component system OmpR family sensor kinase